MYTQEPRQTLRQERLSIGAHHYFFEVKVANNGSKYIVVSHRRKVDGVFEGSKLRIFEDEFQPFLAQLKSNREGNKGELQNVHVTSHETDGDLSTQNNSSVLTEQISIGSSHYSFEMRASTDGSSYWNISQSKKINEQVVGETIMISADAIDPFIIRLQKLMEHDFVPVILDFAKEDDKNGLTPPFFARLREAQDWKQFEQDAFYLLKLIGLHNLHSFLGQNQSGKADGFFKLGNLAVIYDCTLSKGNIVQEKREQLNNYYNRMKQGSIEVADKTVVEFHDCHKQVWVITLSSSKQIKRVNNIDIKEVGIQDLIATYLERLRANLDLHFLEARLKNLGQ